MNLSLPTNDASLLDDSASYDESFVVGDRSYRAPRASQTATEGRGVLIALVATSAVLLGLLLAFTVVSVSSYAPHLGPLVP